MADMLKDIGEVLLSKEDIAAHVRRLGAEITRDYAGKNLLLLCILKGSTVFAADLMREISLSLTLEFISASSYGAGTVSTGSVKVTGEREISFEGYDVLIVEDILDSGRTLDRLGRVLATKNPASLAICTLFDKPERRETQVQPAYVGTTIPDAFIVGYGLDYNENYRNLPFVGVLKPEVYGG